jgi:hypothetical protein
MSTQQDRNDLNDYFTTGRRFRRVDTPISRTRRIEVRPPPHPVAAVSHPVTESRQNDMVVLLPPELAKLIAQQKVEGLDGHPWHKHQVIIWNGMAKFEEQWIRYFRKLDKESKAYKSIFLNIRNKYMAKKNKDVGDDRIQFMVSLTRDTLDIIGDKDVSAFINAAIMSNSILVEEIQNLRNEKEDLGMTEHQIEKRKRKHKAKTQIPSPYEHPLYQ